MLYQLSYLGGGNHGKDGKNHEKRYEKLWNFFGNLKSMNP